jgi:hypothetical protein
MLTYRRFGKKIIYHLHFYKIRRKYLFSVSRILTLAAFDSRLELYIGEPIEVSNYDTILQILMTSDYAIKLYTLGHNYSPRVHTSHYPCPSLVKYPKLLLGYHLDLCRILFRLLSLRCVYYLFAYSLLLHHIIIDNPFNGLLIIYKVSNVYLTYLHAYVYIYIYIYINIYTTLNSIR